ncbi:hypothetical protein [Demequina sp.]|uniref:hypothetical protein n=1 Tax=Demequina sp. TaxID=2050685 RepID=UPI003D0B2100
MSDAPRYEPASYDSADEDVPPMDELDRVAFDAVVRNAPRFGRFIGTGVGIGFVLGLIIGLVLPNTTSVGRGTVAMLMGAGFAIIGAIVSASIVVGLDGTRRAPTEEGFPWEAPSETDTSVGQDAVKRDSE